MNKKFELLKDDYIIDLVGRILYRIRALKDFANVKKGDIGGFVEKEKNLSHAGDCWIYRDAKVYNNARVSDDAKVCDRAKIYGNAIVRGHSYVTDEAQIFGSAIIDDGAFVKNSAIICDHAKVIGEESMICNRSKVCDYAQVIDSAGIYGTSLIHGNAVIYDDAAVFNTTVEGNARIGKCALIKGNRYYIHMGPLSLVHMLQQSHFLTFYKTRNNNIMVSDDKFCYPLDDFLRGIKNGNDKDILREYKKAIRFVKKILK